MTQKFIVSVRGRAQPLCIEADAWSGTVDRGVAFFVGNEKVASLSDADLIAQSDCLPDFPALSQFRGPDLLLPEPACLAAYAEPVRGLEPLPVQAGSALKWLGVPAFWPFLSGGALGFIGGFGLALSHAGVW